MDERSRRHKTTETGDGSRAADEAVGRRRFGGQGGAGSLTSSSRAHMSVVDLRHRDIDSLAQRLDDVVARLAALEPGPDRDARQQVRQALATEGDGRAAVADAERERAELRAQLVDVGRQHLELLNRMSALEAAAPPSGSWAAMGVAQTQHAEHLAQLRHDLEAAAAAQTEALQPLAADLRREAAAAQTEALGALAHDLRHELEIGLAALRSSFEIQQAATTEAQTSLGQDLRSELAALAQGRDEDHLEVVALREEHEQHRQDLHTSWVRLAEQRHELDARMTALRSELDGRSSKTDDAVAELGDELHRRALAAEATADERVELRGRIDEALATMEQLRQDLVAQEQAHARAADRLAALEEVVRTLTEGDADAVAAEHLDALRREVGAAVGRVAATDEELAALRTRAARVEEHMAALQRSLRR